MAAIISRAQCSPLMAKVRGRGSATTEGDLAAVLRAQGWSGSMAASLRHKKARPDGRADWGAPGNSESAVVGRHVVGALGLLAEATILFFDFGKAGSGLGGGGVGFAEGGGSGFEVGFGLLLLSDCFLQF